MQVDIASVPRLGAPLLPESIDARIVLRIYAWIAIVGGVIVYLWAELILPQSAFLALRLDSVPELGDHAAVRSIAAVVTAFGCSAAAFASIANPVDRRRGLFGFAVAHIVFGALFFLQHDAMFSVAFSRLVGWAPLLTGLILFYLAATSTSTPRLGRGLKGLFRPDGLITPDDRFSHVQLLKARPEAIAALRSQYEAQLLEAARREERARLARDLHDAVKQQLFVIQTAAATAQARQESDSQGSKAAIDQIRTSAREAMGEMEAMIDQLQATPLGNAGLVEALTKQCEALGFRTGAGVKLNIGSLPAETALMPSAREAIFRVAQEALANVGRHARAKTVSVTLGVKANRFELDVRDDGVGFDLPAQRETPRGMGTRNMGDRAAEVGGTFLLASTPGRGTTVRFSVPYREPRPYEYLKRALLWIAVAAVTAFAFARGADWQRPWALLVVILAAITVVRYLVAYGRVRSAHGGIAP